MRLRTHSFGHRRRRKALLAAAGAAALIGGAPALPASAAPRAASVAAPTATIHTATPAPELAEGYRTVGADGGVFDYGTYGYLGNVYSAHIKPAAPMVAIAPTPTGAGYWLIGADGGVFNFGDAGFHGSAAVLKLAKPIVGAVATPDGKGYWLVGADGGVFAYGDAHFYGSAAGLKLVKPVVGIAATPDGKGYWLAAADGGVFNYGDAAFYGSEGGAHLSRPVTGIAGPSVGQGTSNPNGLGYRLVGADGGVFNFGNAGFSGSVPSQHITITNAVGITSTPDDGGYWIAGADGMVYAFGDGRFLGDHQTDVTAGIAPKNLLGPWTGIVSIPPGGDTPPPPAQDTFVVSEGTGEIELARPAAKHAASIARPDAETEVTPNVSIYAPDATGDATPLGVITGENTGLTSPGGIAVAPDGTIYVDNDAGFVPEDRTDARTLDTIQVFAPGANGDATPIRTITGTDTGLDEPSGMALDSAGDLYVTNYDGDSLLEFAPGASGDAIPMRTLSDNGFSYPTGVAVQSDGTAQVSNDPDTDDSVGFLDHFAPTASGGAGPVAAPVEGDNTALEYPDGVALTANGNVAVVNEGADSSEGSITEFSPTATGDVVPAVTIAGSNTGLDDSTGVTVDTSGNIWVTNFAGKVSEFAPSASGNVIPSNTFTGDDLKGSVSIAAGPYPQDG